MAMEVNSSCTNLVVHGSDQEIEHASSGAGQDVLAEDIQRILIDFRQGAAALVPRMLSSKTAST